MKPLYEIIYATRMRRDMRRLDKRGKNLELIYEVFHLLEMGEPLPMKYRDHALKGSWNGLVGCRECHIEPDWLLIYQKIKNTIVILACGTGTHSDLF